MQLKDCSTGDFVSIWCIGTLCWDDDIVKIISIDNFWAKVEYKNGHTAEFVPSATCKKLNF